MWRGNGTGDVFCHWIIQAEATEQINLYLSEVYVRRPVGIRVSAHAALPFWLLPGGGTVANDTALRDTGTLLGFVSMDTTANIPV